MFIGNLPAVSNRATWSENCEIRDADTNELVDLTAIDEITIEVRNTRCGVELTGTLSGGEVTLLAGLTTTVTMTIATPAVVSWSDHGLEAGDPVRFTTTGALPTGVTADTFYYVISAGLAEDSFQFSATPGGSAVNTTGTQSGVHTGSSGSIGTFQWRFEAAAMRGLSAKTYEVGLVIEQDDDEVQLVIGTLQVMDGIVS